MRELKYYVATTLDGYIARQDGSLDFFPMEGEHFADLFGRFPETIPDHLRELWGVRGDNRCFDTVLMGRRTYQVGLDAGVTNPYSSLKQYVFSRSMKESPDENVELISEGALSLVRRLKQQPGKAIWLCGGGELATQLFPEIDELIVKLNPILLGEPGIPMFSGQVPLSRLQLSQHHVYPNGFGLFHYRVIHQ